MTKKRAMVQEATTFMSDSIYFTVFPYIAVVLAVGVGLYRYYTNRFSFSSMSSQFLENRELFWGSVPWHYGIVLILITHIIALTVPDLLIAQQRYPLRMLVMQLTGFALGLLAVTGIIILIVRRLIQGKARTVTTIMDWILLIDLLLQVLAGFYISIFHRWGSVWFLYTATPWIVSLVTLSPKIDFVTHLPWIVQFHMVNAFVLIGLFPFTRLVHIFTVPISYLWRPYQVTIWNHTRAGGKDELKIESKRQSS